MFQQGGSLLNLHGYDDEAFNLVMEYLYTAKYKSSPSKPDFCLPLHLKVYVLATELQIVGLQELSGHFFTFNLSNYVENLEVFFSIVKDVYSKTRVSNSALRNVVVQAAVSEMHTFLGENKAWDRLTGLMAAVPEFQKDIMCVMVEHGDREVIAMPQELCKACGPRDEGDGYQMQATCKCCGVEKTLEIL